MTSQRRSLGDTAFHLRSALRSAELAHAASRDPELQGQVSELLRILSSAHRGTLEMREHAGASERAAA